MDAIRYSEYEDPTNVVDHEETVDCDNCTEDPTSPLDPISTFLRMFAIQGQFRPIGPPTMLAGLPPQISRIPPTSLLERLPPQISAPILAELHQLHPSTLARLPPSILALLPPQILALIPPSMLAMEEGRGR